MQPKLSVGELSVDHILRGCAIIIAYNARYIFLELESIYSLGQYFMEEQDAKLDTVSSDLMSFLLEKHKTCKNLEKLPIGIREIQRGINAHKNTDIKHALDFLIQAQYIKVSYDEREGRGGIKQRVNPKYRISDLGIYKLEKPQIFTPNDKYISGINIERVDSLVIVGKHNKVIIHNDFKELGEKIEELVTLVQSNAEKLSDLQLEFISIVKSLESLIISRSPDKSILKLILDKFKEKASSLPADIAGNSLITAISTIVEEIIKSCL